MISTGVSYLLVGVGGALGAISRLAIGNLVRGVLTSAWPWHTFAINISGSFLLGLLVTVLGSRVSGNATAIHHFAAIGFLGAFTTFSTFELETWSLLTQGRWGVAIGYIAGSTLVGLAALAGGIALGRWL